MKVIGVGIDIVDLDVFKKRLDEGMIEELFLPSERDYCSSRARSWESYAARFAGKEATFKALGSGLSQGLRWKNVEIVKLESGDVDVILNGRADELARNQKVDRVHISLTHTAQNACAVVILEG